MPPSQDIVPAQPNTNKSNALVPYHRENGRDMILASAQKALARPLSPGEIFIFEVSQSLANWIAKLNAQGCPVGFTIGAPIRQVSDNNVTYYYGGAFTLNRPGYPPVAIGGITIYERSRQIICDIPKIVDTDIEIHKVKVECNAKIRRWLGFEKKIERWPTSIAHSREINRGGLAFHIGHPGRIGSWKTPLFLYRQGYFATHTQPDSQTTWAPFDAFMSSWIKMTAAPDAPIVNDFTGMDVRPHYKATTSTTPHL